MFSISSWPVMNTRISSLININIWKESRDSSNLAGASEWIVKIVDSMARNQSSFGSDICLENEWQHILKKIILF